MGKLTINGPFSIAMLNYQRVYTPPCSSTNQYMYLGTSILMPDPYCAWPFQFGPETIHFGKGKYLLDPFGAQASTGRD